MGVCELVGVPKQRRPASDGPESVTLTANSKGAGYRPGRLRPVCQPPSAKAARLSATLALSLDMIEVASIRVVYTCAHSFHLLPTAIHTLGYPKSDCGATTNIETGFSGRTSPLSLTGGTDTSLTALHTYAFSTGSGGLNSLPLGL